MEALIRKVACLIASFVGTKTVVFLVASVSVEASPVLLMRSAKLVALNRLDKS